MLDYRILVVDDNHTQRKLLMQHLKTMGVARVEQAASCEHAAHQLAEAYDKNESFDLILLDWHMRGGSGLRFLTERRYDARFGSVPIIMMTADPRNILMALKYGATSYIVKPVSYGDLEKSIRQALQLREMRR